MLPSKPELEKFCDQWLASWSRDATTLASFYTSTAFYRDPARSNGLKGREALQEYFAKLLLKYPGWAWKRQELYPTEAGFVLKWQATLKSGQQFEGLDIVELNDGKIQRNEVYFDPSPLL